MLTRVAAELQRALTADLGMVEGVRAAGGGHAARSVRRVSRRPVRGRPSRVAATRIPVVVVEVPAARERPAAPAIAAMLNLQDPFDLYYVIPKHWAALPPRELNPDDRDRGHEHLAILRNLTPDYALVATTGRQPAWTTAAAQVLPW
jgi:hypothetical protein